MESAIPEHLTVSRTLPPRKGEDFTPPYPSFVARQAPSVRQVVMAYLGEQSWPRPARSGLGDALSGPDGPRHHDVATQAHPQDGRPADLVTVAYWDDLAAFDRWLARNHEPWLAGGDGAGRWIEVIRPTVERFETIFGARSKPEGVAVLADGWSGQVREHGYWGSMRDRFPAAQIDPLHDPGEIDVERAGDRVRVRPRGSICLIRSGQDWTGTEPAERSIYLEDVQPSLRAGMDFLRDEGLGIGCLANRYLTVLDDAGEPTEATYGLSWWRSLADLERWSESHPTHLAIFGAFMKLVAAQGGRTKLRLYHEVSVASPGEQLFEYARCHDHTGLLGTRVVADPGSS